jgi:acetylornithine deacetylase/succinyl-diaminopimelate desuccinylase-like protein
MTPGTLRPQADALSSAVIRRTVKLAEIPAPTGREDARRERVRSWWLRDGWTDVRTDDAGNLWARVRPGDGPAVVLAAHLDTVFDDTVDHQVRQEGTRLCGPSVGDDSVAVAALSALGTLLAAGTGTTPAWIVATVGEEGLGNLRGITEVIRQDQVPLAAVVAIEGNYLGRIATVGVGSVRWRVTVSGPGGHAWERAGAPSAVHAAARMVSGLAALPRRGAGSGPGRRSSVNVGVFSGGEAVNARARHAVFLVDLRATGAAALADLEARARRVVRAPSEQITVGIEELGRRPAGELDQAHPLAAAAAAALRAAGLRARFTAASTDANAAHAAGVPAIAIGVTTGGGEHTPDEWIDTLPLGAGLGCAAATIAGWEGGER